jgi:hypothetical protein
MSDFNYGQKAQLDLIEKQIQYVQQMMTPRMIVVERTLRDEFAMAALTGLCADPDLSPLSERVAEHAYRLADAMMEARK